MLISGSDDKRREPPNFRIITIFGLLKMEKYSSITIITIITASQSHNSLKFATMNEGKEQGRNKVCKTKNVLPISNNETHNKVMYHARLIWHRDVTKERSFASENRDFREYFGCGTNVVVHMWMLLVEHDLIYSGLTTNHHNN